MKVAVLLLAHKNKKQLDRLISVLDHPSVDIYIHLDKKSSLSPSDFQHQNVRFTEKRIDIALFDFSMVEAEMELLRTALSHEQYGYYILLSGQCYPLRHVDDIYNYLCKNYPKPLIEIIDTEIVTMFQHVFKYSYTLKKFRIYSEALLKKYLPSKWKRFYRYVPKGIDRVAALVIQLFVKSPKQRLNNMGIKPYFGQQWWILPDVVIDEILQFFENKDFCNCIRDCYSCDETFFQTAIMVYADKFGIVINDEGPFKGYYMNKKWYTSFSGEHPIVLTESNFEQIIATKKPSTRLFARKFDIDTDAVILDMLDKRSLDLHNEAIQD